ncbi:MAG: ECF transporter S component [Bacillota bacterium]|nr:ECF transporter S component [Bacillota bacterium]
MSGLFTMAGPRSRVQILVRIGVLVAVSFLLMMVEFSVPPFPAYLQYDPSEVPALLGGFAMGPAAGLAVVAGKCLLFLFSGKDEAGIIGTAANFVAGFPLVVVAAWIYQRMHTRSGAMAGMAAGIVAAVAATSIGNYYVFLPAWGIPVQGRAALIVSTLIPFNVLKGVLTAVITLLLYKRIRGWLH